MFVSGKLFQPSPMIATKARAYLSETPIRCSTLGWLHALTTNIRLGWKSLPWTFVLAYYENL